MQRPRDGDVVEVVARAKGSGAGLSPTGHPGVDQPRVHRVALGRAEAEPLHDPGAKPLDEHVSAADDVEHRRDGLARLQVDRQHRPAPLEAAGGVTDTRATHTDDVGAQVGKQHRGEGAWADSDELEDLHPGEHRYILSGASTPHSARPLAMT